MNYKTQKENDKFCFDIFDSILDKVSDWIAANIAPQEVYEDKDLIDWAKDQDPNYIFDEKYLEKWALDNGFVKEEE